MIVDSVSPQSKLALMKNLFGFELAGIIVNDSVTREAIRRDQMKKFFKFGHDDVVYCKYYEVIYILFHTGMRISEFYGLIMKDVDLTNNIINIDHQLQRTSDMKYIMGHSDIAVKLNVYTHIGLDDATEELRKLEEMESVRRELEKGQAKPVSQKMFKAI